MTEIKKISKNLHEPERRKTWIKIIEDNLQE